MAKYLLIESRDPFESPDTANYLDWAKGLVKDGHTVTLFLVQNGVLPARPSAASARRRKPASRCWPTTSRSGSGASPRTVWRRE